MKRFFTLLLMLLPLVSWGQDVIYGGGSGTEADPYQINAAEHLIALATAVNNGNSYAGTYFQLMNSLTITDTWTPIGKDNSHPFSGTFDGGNNTLTLSESLFDYVTDGRISNLTVSVTATNTNINGIVASYVNNSVIENVTSEGSLTSQQTYNNAGGLVFMVENGTQILNCTNNSTISGYNIAGGIAYCIDSREGETTTSLIDGCINNGDISTSNSWNGWAGGIAGNMYGGTVSNCTNNGDISSVVQAAGGIVGCAFDYNFTEESSDPPAQTMLFINNVNNGTVTGVQAAGGIVGLGDSNWNDIYIINCLNTGAISGDALISGIAGIAQTVRGGDDTNPANEGNEDLIVIQNCGNIGTITISSSGNPGASIAVMDGAGKEISKDCVYLEQDLERIEDFLRNSIGYLRIVDSNNFQYNLEALSCLIKKVAYRVEKEMRYVHPYSKLFSVNYLDFVEKGNNAFHEILPVEDERECYILLPKGTLLGVNIGYQSMDRKKEVYELLQGNGYNMKKVEIGVRGE